MMAIAFLYISEKLLPTIGVANAGWPLMTALTVLVNGSLCLYCAFSRRDLYGLIAGIMTVKVTP